MKKLNIVSFNVPYPPDYGGVIDVFYKIKSLKELSFNIILHTFYYGRKVTDELRYLCDEIYLYERNKSLKYYFSNLPFIVNTRKNNELLRNINKNSHPIIFEGIHTTYHLYKNNIDKNRCFIRTHNIEKNYYKSLYLNNSYFKKIYFYSEYCKLKKYENIVIPKAQGIFSISENDKKFFEQLNKETYTIYPFHRYNRVESEAGIGDYILIHGDFTIKQNFNSLKWLIKNVINKVNYKTIIAGKMQKKIHFNKKNLIVITNPTEEEMDNLIKNSHICLIHNTNTDGFKIKLLFSLYKGKFCISNSNSISDPSLYEICHIANTQDEYIDKINELMHKEFTNNELEKRILVLKKFNNIENAHRIAKVIYGYH